MIEHFFGLLMTQTWQITALAIVVAVVVKLGAKNRPHLAHALWVLVLIKCVTPPLWGHSLGVFSQLQARLMPDESVSLLDASNSPANVPVAIAETLDQAPQIDVPDSEHGQPETYEPDDLLAMADTEPPEDASLQWNGGTEIELDEAVQLPDELRAKTALPESTLPVEGVESDASWLRPGWFLLSGLAAGAIMTMFIMVYRCLRCLREIHRHRTTEFDDPLRERIQHLSRQLRIRRIPQIVVSDVLFGPAVLGLLRHTIVLPRCLLTSSETSMKAESGERKAEARDNEEHATTVCKSPLSAVGFPLSFLDPILAHELLHIRRGDLRTGTLQAIAQSLWWFHPAVRLTNRWLSREAERCCDEQVIAELGCSPAHYARSLLSVIECKHQLQPIPVFPGMKPVEITSQRMERIMSLKNGLKKQTPLWCWVIIVGLAFVVLPGAVAKPAADDLNSSPVTKPESDLTAQELDSTDVVSAADPDESDVQTDEVESNDIVIHGAVRKPGRYDLSMRTKTSLLDAIALAGGLADELSDKIWIIRSERNVTEPVLVRSRYRDALKDPDKDIQIFGGDLVVVDEATFAFQNEMNDPFLFDEAELPVGSKTGDTLRERLRRNVSMTTPPNYSLSRLIRGYAGFHGVHVAFAVSLLKRADNVLEKPTSMMTFENKPLLYVLRDILATSGLTFEVRHSGILVVPADDADRDAEAATSPPLSVMVYPVADLVVPMRNVVASGIHPIESNVEASRAILPPAAAVPRPVRDPAARIHLSGKSTVENDQSLKVDFAPLMELIKASVEPDSWREHGTVAVEEPTLSLIIRQSEKAHEEIHELLSQLRDAQDQSVRIPCLVVHLTKESQTKWLEEQCSLHPLEHGCRWALLPRQRCESFTQALLEQKPEVLSRPVLRTTSGQTTTITVGRSAVSGMPPIGIRLEVTPHVLPDSKVIRMQHSFSIGELANEMPQPIESLVGSGQTLLLLIEDPEDKEKPHAARSQYLLMMTPEHIPQKEENVSIGTPRDSALAVDPTDSTDK